MVNARSGSMLAFFGAVVASPESTERAARATMSTWSGAFTSGVVIQVTRAVALTELRLLAQAPLRYRRQILALKRELEGELSVALCLYTH